MSNRGIFIVLEGADGSGKGVQARLLAERLEATGRTVCATAEPTSSITGFLIRSGLRGTLSFDGAEMALLFAVDRHWHVRQQIRPALARGEVVVCDRYELSNLVYRAAEQPMRRCTRCGWEGDHDSIHHSPRLGGQQCPTCFAADPAWPRYDVIEWARALSRGCPRPDLTIVLDVPTELALERREARGRAMDRYEGDEMQRRVCELYRRAGELLPGERVVVVDGTGSEGEVAERVLEVAREVLHG